MKNYREDCLRLANECVNGAREYDYGTPEDNFDKIAELWSVYLDYPVLKGDVANMMMLLKIARARTGKGTDDCYVDIAGYASCAYELSKTFNDRVHDILEDIRTNNDEELAEPDDIQEHIESSYESSYLDDLRKEKRCNELKKEGLTTKEISESLKMPVSLVETLISRTGGGIYE